MHYCNYPNQQIRNYRIASSGIRHCGVVSPHTVALFPYNGGSRLHYSSPSGVRPFRSGGSIVASDVREPLRLAAAATLVFDVVGLVRAPGLLRR